jgi:DNA invertase Pin-like site-specific DNA recombinase
MLVGYMRVSSDTDRQTTALQRDALLAAGVVRVICLKIRPAVRGMIAEDSSRRSTTSGPAMA